MLPGRLCWDAVFAAAAIDKFVDDCVEVSPGVARDEIACRYAENKDDLRPLPELPMPPPPPLPLPTF